MVNVETAIPGKKSQELYKRRGEAVVQGPYPFFGLKESSSY